VVAGSNPVHPTKKGISATTKLWLSCLERENWELAHIFEQAKQLKAQSEAKGLIYYAFAKS
jgi:TfoX/Sxy family transcriptional regulator of competence genes